MILHRPSLNTTTRCHSVFSLRSPVVLSRQLSDVATVRLQIGRPSCVRFISGSFPRLPTMITLLTDPAMLGCFLSFERFEFGFDLGKQSVDFRLAQFEIA